MIDLLELVPFFVWQYNAPMEPVNFQEHSYNQVGASGECPHCRVTSYFRPVATYVQWSELVSAASCQACKGYVLAIGHRAGQNTPSQSVTVYPLGKPNDTVAPEIAQISKVVADDFREALRCQWIKAYKGCVVLCRRAVQASALALGAPKKKKLDKQIDALFDAGKITESLKDFAHEVRLTANKGAHPDKDTNQPASDADIEEDDNLQDVSEKDAEDIILFTREYLHHVYVLPAKLKARKTPPPPTP